MSLQQVILRHCAEKDQDGEETGEDEEEKDAEEEEQDTEEREGNEEKARMMRKNSKPRTDARA